MQGKVQKHENFMAELNANQGRTESVIESGQQLIDSDHYAKPIIQYDNLPAYPHLILTF